MKKIFSVIIAMALLCALLAGCNDATDPIDQDPVVPQDIVTPEEPEFSEEDADFTAKVIAPDANEAGMIFLAMPENDIFAEQLQIAEDNGFCWAESLFAIEESYTKYAVQMPNQLAAEGSGFEFILNTTAADSDEIRPAIGFSAVFYFTADEDNLGANVYAELLALCETLEDVGEGWVLPDASALKDIGIHIYTMYNGEAQDITDRASFGINLAEKAEGKLLFTYGAVIVDREITDFAAEGAPLNVSMEEELIWSDGAKDGKMAATWWIGK